jgi:hypothetical protein
MLDPVTNSRISSRLLAGIASLAVMAGTFGLAAGFPERSGERSVYSRHEVGKPRRAEPPRHVALSDNGAAHLARRHLSGRRAVDSTGTPSSIAAPQHPDQVEDRLVAEEPLTPEPAGAPQPAPNPGAPEPGPAPAPSPPTEPSPAPGSEPPPAPSPQPGPSPSPLPLPAPRRQSSPSPPAAVPHSQGGAEPIFESGFDSGGFGGWYVQSLPGRATLRSSNPFQGTGAAHFEVRDGDIEPDTGSERSEVSGPTFDEGQDLYIRDAIRVPGSSSFDGSWQIVQQLHETDWGGSPGIAVFLDADDTLSIGSGDGDTTYWEGTELQRDRWYDLVYRVNLSRDSGAGFVEVWLDGVQRDLEGGTRAYGQTIQTGHTYIKAGIYRSRSSTGTSLIEHDSIVVGTSLAAVTAG